jgi:DNA-binding LacI/PurR family transcriptional regulator
VGPNQEPTISAGFGRARDVVTHSSTAVVAFNDALAIGVIKGLSRRGVLVPDEISVVGMDNVLLAEVIEPELTTVASPLRAQGSTAVRNLVAMTAGAKSSGEPLIMPAQLVVRRSTAQRNRKRTSPASGTTNVPGFSRSAARSIDARSR